MSSRSSDIAVLLVQLLAIIGAAPFIYLYFVGSYGLAISLLWGWLILPSFPGLGLPAVTLLQGVAVAAFSAVFRRHGKSGNGTSKAVDLMPWLSPWFIISFGWLLSVVLF